jgi:hypothetical protein
MEMRNAIDGMRNTIDQILESSGGSIPAKANPLKLTKSGKPKKISDRKGMPTPNGDWLKKMKNDHGDEMKAFHEASESKRGTSMKFASNYRKEHEEEYKNFVAQWKESHSDSGSTSSTLEAEEADTSVPSAVPATSSAPVPVPSTGSAKKPVKKAQKAITTAVTTPIESKIPEEMLPFTMDGVTYIRKGYQRPDGNHLWTSGYLWASNKGAKGAYVGQIQTNGLIDKTMSEPQA